MKHLYAFFITVFLLCSHISILRAQSFGVPDSIQISLLTCSPHDEVYSLYGHTALRVEDKQSGVDVAVNYGMFSFDKPFFVLRFVFGLTDYTVAVVPFRDFCREYEYYGCSVTQQVLNLSSEDKISVINAIKENLKPENRIYRYNYFYNNCTTKAVGIVFDNIDGKIVFNDHVPEGMTFRKMLHAMTCNNPWAQLGNDMLLGVYADRKMSLEEYHFLPHSMLSAMDSAYIVDKQNVRRSAVVMKEVVMNESGLVEDKSFSFSPMLCSICFLIFNIIVTLVEIKRKKYFWMYDLIFLILIGLGGIIITSMIFSQHPTVSLNVQILLFNPVPLLFAYHAIKKYKNKEFSKFWLIEIVLICLMVVLYSYGIQWIAPPVLLLALSLLIRCIAKFKYYPQSKIVKS